MLELETQEELTAVKRAILENSRTEAYAEFPQHTGLEIRARCREADGRLRRFTIRRVPGMTYESVAEAVRRAL
jgi:hypothetical protein